MIGPVKLLYPMNQSDLKKKTTHFLVTRFFPRFLKFFGFYFDFSLAPCDMPLYLPGLWGCRFMILNDKEL